MSDLSKWKQNCLIECFSKVSFFFLFSFSCQITGVIEQLQKTIVCVDGMSFPDLYKI